MENRHDSPYLWVNWVMWLANTNGRKPPVFSLERSQQIKRQWTSSVYIKQRSGWENMGLEPLGHCAQLKKVITKTAAYRNVAKQSAS